VVGVRSCTRRAAQLERPAGRSSQAATCVGIQAEARPANLPAEDPNPTPRAVFDLPHSTAELWCLSDLLEHLHDLGQYQSSTEKKALYIPKVFRGGRPGLVIALGTAGSAETSSQNGCVVVGTKIFLHDPNGDTPIPIADGTRGCSIGFWTPRSPPMLSVRSRHCPMRHRSFS
jgi:hypothetical protein